MDNSDLLKQELKKLLITMHKGESLTITLGKILDVINGVTYIEKRKIIYVLKGMYQEELRVFPTTEEDKNYVKGWNESAKENNFAVDLAIDVIMGEK